MSDKLKYGDILFLNVVKETDDCKLDSFAELGFLGSTGFINRGLSVTFIGAQKQIMNPQIGHYVFNNQSFDYRECLFRVLPLLDFVYCKEKTAIEEKIDRMNSKSDALKIELKNNDAAYLPDPNNYKDKETVEIDDSYDKIIKMKLDKLRQRVYQETERLEKINIQYANELKNNKNMIDELTGTEVSYNNQIILQHLVSGYYLSIGNKNNRGDNLTKKAYLSPLINKNVVLKFSPKFKYRTSNCNVHFNDDVLLKYSSKDFSLYYDKNAKIPLLNNDYNLPLRAKLLENKRLKHNLLFSGNSACTIKITKFKSGKETDKIGGGDLIRIWHVNKERFINASYCFSGPSSNNEELFVLKKNSGNANYLYSIFEINHFKIDCDISDHICCINPAYRSKEDVAHSLYLKSFALGRNITVKNGKLVIDDHTFDMSKIFDEDNAVVYENKIEEDTSAPNIDDINKNDNVKSYTTFKFHSILQNINMLNNNKVYYLTSDGGYLTVTNIGLDKFWYKFLKDQRQGYQEFWETYEQYLPKNHIEKFKRFTPMIEVNKDKCYVCELKKQTSAENTFMIKRLNDIEVKEIYFVRSFFNYLTGFRDKLISRSFIRKRDFYKLEANIKQLISFLFTEYFDGKFSNNFKMVLSEIYKNRQTLLREYNIIEIITDIINECNSDLKRSVNLGLENIENKHEITKTLAEVLYILINNNSKNTKYCSQWLEMFIELTIKTSKYKIDLFIENIIIQVFKNNVQLIKYKINKATIEKLLQLIFKFNKYEHIKILRSLIVCRKQVIYENQHEITVLLLKDSNRRNKILFQIDHKGDAFRINYELIGWVQVDINDLRYYDSKTHSENRNYVFFKQAIKLFTELSNSRNYLSIDILREQYSFKTLLGLINYLDEHNFQLKIVLIRLMLKLYIDVIDYHMDSYKTSIKVLNKEIDEENINSVIFSGYDPNATDNSIIEEKSSTKNVETLTLKHRGIKYNQKPLSKSETSYKNIITDDNPNSNSVTFKSGTYLSNKNYLQKQKNDALKLFLEYNIDNTIEILKSDEIDIYAFKYIKQVLKLFKIMMKTEIIEAKHIENFYRTYYTLIKVYINQNADCIDISSFKKDDIKHIDKIIHDIQMLIVKILNLFVYFNFKFDLVDFYNKQNIKLTKTSIIKRFMERETEKTYTFLVSTDIMEILVHFLNKQHLKSLKLNQNAINAIFFLNSKHNFLLEDFENSLFISGRNLGIYHYLASFSKRLEKVAENSQRWLINDAPDDVTTVRMELNKLFEMILRSCKENNEPKNFDPTLGAEPADMRQMKQFLHNEMTLYYINFFFEHSNNKLIQLIQKICVSLPIIDSLFKIIEWLFKYRHISSIDFNEDQKLIFFLTAILMYKNTLACRIISKKYIPLIIELFERYNDFCVILYSLFSCEDCYNEKIMKESAEFYTIINQIFKKSADQSIDSLYRSFNLSILSLILSSKKVRKQTKIFKHLQLYMFLNIRKHFDINMLMRDSTTIEKQSRAIFEKVQIHNYSTFLVADNLCLSFSILKLLKKFGLGNNKLTKSVCQNFYSIRSISKIVSSYSVPIFYKEEILCFMNRIYLHKENTNAYNYKDLIEHLWCDLMIVMKDIFTDLVDVVTNNDNEVYVATTNLFKSLTDIRNKFIIKAYETIELVIRKYQDLKLTEVEQSSFYSGINTLLEFKELAIQNEELAPYFYNIIKALKENWQSGLCHLEKSIEDQLALIEDVGFVYNHFTKQNEKSSKQLSMANKFSVRKLKTQIRNVKTFGSTNIEPDENEKEIFCAFEVKVNAEYFEILQYLLKRPETFDSTMEHILRYLIDDPDNITKLDHSISLIKLFRNYIEDIHSSKACIMDWSNDFYDENLQEIIKRQNKLIDFGIITLIVNNIEHHHQNQQILTETLYLGIAILYGGNESAQSKFYIDFTENKNSTFLLKLKTTLDSSFEYLFEIFEKLSLCYIKRYIGNKTIDDIIKNMICKQEFITNEKVIQLVFRFLQLLCEGHNSSLQNYLRMQVDQLSTSNSGHINFVNIASVSFGFIVKYINPEALEIGFMILDFLIEVIQGPCVENQRQLFDDKVLDYCNDLFVELLSDDRVNMKGFYGYNDKNKLHRFIIKTVTMINSLLEANKYEAISIYATNNICIEYLIYHMSQEFRTYMKTAIPKFSKIFGLETMEKKSSIELLLHENNMANSALYKLNTSVFMKDKYKKIKFKPQRFFKEIYFTNFDNDLCDLFSIYFLIKYIADHNHSVSIYINKLSGIESLAVDFFEYFTGKVEIVHKTRILDFMFIIHPCCFYASTTQVNKLLRKIKRDTPKDKVKDIIDFSDKVFVSMKSHCRLDHKFQKLKISLKAYEVINVSVTILGIVVNLIMLLFFKKKADGGFAIDDDSFNHKHPTFITIGFILLLTSVTRLYFWMLVKGNVALKNMLNDYSTELKMKIRELINEKGANSSKINIHTVNLLRDSKKDIKELINSYNFLINRKELSANFILTFKIVNFYVNNSTLKYHMFIILCLVMALFFNYTFLFGILLLDIIQHFDILTNLIVSLTSNKKQLLLTMFLLGLVAYSYSVFAYIFLNEDFFMSSLGENICSSIFHCFLSIISLGPRSTGSIGDIIMKVSYGKREHYFIRWIFDFTAWTIINLILLNVIFGAIIDTFAALRDLNKKINDDLNNKCIICSLDRSTLEKYTQGFSHHVKQDHNLYNYLYFLYYLQNKDKTELSGLESYVIDNLTAKNINWVPLLRCKSLPTNFNIVSDADDSQKLNDIAKHIDKCLKELKKIS